ncbi:MAG: NAD(P)-dependent oxidoreductase [Phycisphaerae bacterium]|nr:NAD(P)-dependent oxidoreductase [Phycisphaerae bacterium]
MKILCTGSGGFLGHALKSLCECDEVGFVGYDIASGRDILKRDEFLTTCMAEQPDVVVHAAAVADLYDSDKNLDKNFSINVLGTYYVGRICSILNIPIVYISTCCAYGNQGERRIVDEGVEAIPTETYAWSKLAGEKALGCVGSIRGCILRLGTFYGPGMRDTLFNRVVVERVFERRTIEVHGDGEQTRRYVHVDDVAAAIIRAAAFCKKNAWTNERNNPLPIFNILGDTEYSVNDTIDLVSEITGLIPKVKYVGQRDGQIIGQKVACDRARTYLGWTQKISYRQGMADFIEAYRRERDQREQYERQDQARRNAVEDMRDAGVDG